MKWPKTLSDFWSPRNVQGFDFQKLALALNAPPVRVNFLQALFEHLWTLNVSVDKLLAENASPEKIRDIAAGRNMLVKVLQQIESSENSVAMELHHTPDDLLSKLAVDPAPGK